MEPGRTVKSKVDSVGYTGHLLGAFSRIKKVTGESYRNSRAQIVYYIPGVFLVSMGFSLIFAPTLFVGLLSGLLLYVGVMSIYLGRKLLKANVKFKEVVRQVEARIYVRGHAPQEPVQWEEQSAGQNAAPDKKTVFH